MAISEFISTFKDTTLGTVVLGLVGSLLATVLAFGSRELVRYIQNKREKRFYNLGYVTGFITGNVEHHPVFIEFLAAGLVKVMLQCTLTICAFIAVSFIFTLSADVIGLLTSLLVLSGGLFSFLAACDNYYTLKNGVTWHIEAIKKENGGMERK
jgi:hypothetical protein